MARSPAAPAKEPATYELAMAELDRLVAQMEGGQLPLDQLLDGYRRGADLLALDDARRIAELERKIGQLTMENDFLKRAFEHFRDYHPAAVVSGADACLKKSSKPRRKAKP